MSHFGLVCPPVPGHLHPTLALGRELARRGHQVTVLGHPMAEAAAGRAELGFQTVGTREFPPGKLEEAFEQFAVLRGRAAFEHMLRLGVLAAAGHLRDIPDVIRERQIDALLVDQMCLTAGAAGELAEVPFIGLCNALPLDGDLGVPPCGLNWAYRPGLLGRMRNAIGHLRIVRYALRDGWEILRMVNRAGARRRWYDGKAWQSRLATIAQIPEEFDFPCRRPSTFHYVGPMYDPVVHGSVAFPWERLDGRPLVYATLGTLLNRPETLRKVALACEPLPVQLVISLGRMSPDAVGPLPGNPLVASYLPQRELLERAELAVTHAGLNTAMDALSCGIPMVAIPVGSDQPGVAARIEWHGAGERILPEQLSVERLRAAVERVLSEPSFRASARRLQHAIESSGGARRAADVIEGVLRCAPSDVDRRDHEGRSARRPAAAQG